MAFAAGDEIGVGLAQLLDLGIRVFELMAQLFVQIHEPLVLGSLPLFTFTFTFIRWWVDNEVAVNHVALRLDVPGTLHASIPLLLLELLLLLLPPQLILFLLVWFHLYIYIY